MTFLDKNQMTKILTPSVLHIINALHEEGEARVVGGAVRDILMDRKVGDIDLATELPPQRVIDILSAHHIKTVQTGLAHGTITAVIDHVGYEITTLRRDIATDGRHATVAFTNDWQADAQRRDFTFNALYVDSKGQVYDYFDGQKDASDGYIRFIGDAEARIREDVLRILRFFRFTAWFSHKDADASALAACHELAYLIPQLSAERVAKEVLKLLHAKNPLPAWRLMQECDVIKYVIPEATHLDRLEALLKNERTHNQQQSSLTRLAALLPQNREIAISVATRLKFSTKDSEVLSALSLLPALTHEAHTPLLLRRFLYHYGLENTRAALFLGTQVISEGLETIEAWESPVFPLKGQDIVKLGVTAGPRVGDILRVTEKWWVDGNFKADYKASLAYAEQYLQDHP